MGFWLVVSSDTTCIHDENSKCVALIEETEGQWHYAESWADVKHTLNRRTLWRLCNECYPVPGVTR